ncbi:hypothetical protein CGCVW01_v003496 [Colletotrichum viniferum]|nr:hypothetical protein CGCVW01_v003496 [Colletotrichum viniferum]
MADREASLSSGATDDGNHKELAIKKEANSKLWIKSNGKVDWHAVGVYHVFRAFWSRLFHILPFPRLSRL